MNSHYSAAHPQCEGHEDAGAAPLDDVLRVVELEVVVQHDLGRLVHAVEAVVAQQQDVQLQVRALLLSLDVRQAALEIYSQSS